MEKRLPDSVNRPRALLVSPEAPYPLDGGGALRTASLLHYLAARYDVDLIAFQHPGQRIVENLPPGLVRRASLVPLRHHAPGVFARALRNASRVIRQRPPLVDRFGGYEDEIRAAIGDRRYEVCVLEHFWTASYLPLMRSVADRTLLDLHNIESAWHASCAATAGFPRNVLHRAFAAASLREERNRLKLCDLALVTSEDDARRVRGICASTPSSVYPNAIPWRFDEHTEPDFAIAFSGNMEYEPNQTGLRWFLREIWPLVRARFPELQFRVIGKNASAIAGDAAEAENVSCTGPVEDPFAHLTRAMLCVAPLRSGSGTRLKIIEAWAASRAVVSTNLGAEGLCAKNHETIRIADTPDLFAAAITELIENKALRQKIAKSGRALYERKYTWNSAWTTLSTVL